MDLATAVERYALLAFDIAKRTGVCRDMDHLRGWEFGRLPLPDRVGRQWVVRLRIQQYRGVSRRGAARWGGERLLVARLELPNEASQEVAEQHLRQVAVTGVVPVPQALRRVA